MSKNTLPNLRDQGFFLYFFKITFKAKVVVILTSAM